METQTFDYMLEEIYGAFGRARPPTGSPAYRSIFRRTCEERSLPDACAKFIANAISDYDSLPMNLGKAIIAEFGNWLDLHPELRARESQGCMECDVKTPGWFTVWKPDGTRLLCECACRKGYSAGWTRKRALAAGYLLEDPLRANAGAFPTGLCRNAIGHNEAPRPAHLEELEEAGF